MRFARLGPTALLCLIAGASTALPACAAAQDDSIVSSRPPELKARLEAALASKGKNHKPRTEHLQPDGRPKYTNRLILEDSPYLLQHAHNPVDWYPWGPEAFARARREGKLVFLSIGYSTCHWCHVMERESFEDLAIAKLLNEHFITIKVDREVRPDIDQVYMTALTLLTGTGGWPMSSILTPEGQTITAGTYFPPSDFGDLLGRALALWGDRPDALREQAERIAGAVARTLASQAAASELGPEVTDRAIADLLARFDEMQGGFGPAPKFPKEPQLGLLLDHALRRGDDAALDAAVFTLEAMDRGGIHDQVAGGFHRYAIDNEWLVPHFEKMLYNQAQLARLNLAACRQGAEPDLCRVARRTLDFVLRDLTSPEGGFYSATDADSEGEEGRFFLWTPGEIKAALEPEDAELAIELYGVTQTGNFEGRSILHLEADPEALATEHGLGSDQLWQRIDRINEALYAARETRPHPHRDEKILTAWNGMMIAALAEAGDVLKEPKYVAAAERAAELIWSKLRPRPGAIRRVYFQGRSAQPGLLQDYAFLGQGLVALYDATGEARWLARAAELARALTERFSEPDGGLFMSEAKEQAPLMVRPREVRDGAIPSGVSAAIDLLAALAQRTQETSFGRRAKELVGAVSGRAQSDPAAYPSLLQALDRLRQGDTGPKQYAGRGQVRLLAQVTNRGKDGQLMLELAIAPGWHVNAHQPLQDYLAGTVLSLPADQPAWRIDALEYPDPEVLKLGFQRESLAVYQGRVRIEARLLRERQRVSSAKEWLPLELKLQACSDERCLAPETRVLQVPIEQAPNSGS